MLIAIDGPAGSGKSTVARELARRLGFSYADTGALYRGFTWAVLQKGIDPHDWVRVIQLARELALELTPLPGGACKVVLEGQDISAHLRTPAVEEWTPYLAAIPEVREVLRAKQRRLASLGDLVIEGRDVTTRVFPKADSKFFLDASFEERVRRRHQELGFQGSVLSVEETSQKMKERDRIDSGRAADPLVRAKDAIYLDTTSLSVPQVVSEILRLLRERRSRSRLLYAILHQPVLPLIRLCFGFKVEGQENIPKRGAFILASNHLSYVDPPCLGYASPRQLAYLARDSLFRIPLFVGLIKALNAFPIRRAAADRTGLATVIRLLLEGRGVVFFPEGTRSKTGKLGPPKSGIGYVALRTEAPVIPAWIQGTNEVLPRGARWICFRRITVRFGNAVPLDDLVRESSETKGVYEAATTRIMHAIEDLGQHKG